MGKRLAAGLSLALALIATSALAAEQHPGVKVEYGTLSTADGLHLRTIVTVPEGGPERHPAILFVHWLSCDTVALPPEGGGGWSMMIRRLIRESGAVFWRTEKRGVGGSDGRCETLDYDTELADHQAALKALRSRPDVDPNRIVIFGASMGATYAPLIAQADPVAGVMVWGGGALTWYERMLAFERNALELGGTSPEKIAPEMTLKAKLFSRYLLAGESPQLIAKADPELAGAWSRVVGATATAHYGRPFSFHQQAQRKNWTGAWGSIRAPVLVLHGGYDWFETIAGAQSIVRAVESNGNRRVTLEVVPGIDHHFTRFASERDAYREEQGKPDPDQAVGIMLSWLKPIYQ